MRAPGWTVDLNADLGEGVADDEALLTVVSSANVCAGAYAGSLAVTRETMRRAAEAGVAVGAHVGYPDRRNFGRRTMTLGAVALRETLARQLDVCLEAAADAGTELRYFKPHGALYHDASTSVSVAEVLAAFAKTYRLGLLYQPGTQLSRRARDLGVRCVAEGFADRRYQRNGRLVPRGEAGATIDDDDAIVGQALHLIREGVDEAAIESLCLHGDHAGAVQRARTLRRALEREHVSIRTPWLP